MRSFYSVSTALFAALLLVACSNTIQFTSSPLVPGAEGGVKVTKDKNQNYAISVNVVNLADSKELDPPKSTYVVWMETPENDVRRLGQIKSSSGLLSKAKKANMRAVSTVRPLRIFITAEDNPNVSYPGREVLTTRSIDA